MIIHCTILSSRKKFIAKKRKITLEIKYVQVSDFFEDNIRALPSEHCEEDAIQQLYIQVIQQFGTHYTTEVVMGAKAVQEFKFKNSDLDRFQSIGISAKVRGLIYFNKLIVF